MTRHIRRTVTALACVTALALIVTACRGSGGDPQAQTSQTNAPQANAPQADAPQTDASQTDASQTAAPQQSQGARPRPVNPVGGQPDGPPITPKPGGPLTPSKTTYKIDAIEFFLTPDQFVEYKFRLDTGQRMIFNWKATGPVEVDFHTVPDGKPISASETYQRGPASSGSGDYRSPYPGLHGWYWHNTGKEPVKIVLNAAGFWTEAWMFSGDPVGDAMPLQDPAPPEN